MPWRRLDYTKRGFAATGLALLARSGAGLRARAPRLLGRGLGLGGRLLTGCRRLGRRSLGHLDRLLRQVDHELCDLALPEAGADVAAAPLALEVLASVLRLRLVA